MEEVKGGRTRKPRQAWSVYGAQVQNLTADVQGRGNRSMSEVRALIVDDSTVMRKIVERSLRQAGLESLVVEEAGSGTEGLDKLRAGRFDLILSDINMPMMDGLE